jgi:alpha-beta hydrolase superfamily lysophospholipase
MLDRMIRRAPRGAITIPTTLLLASRDRIIDSAATREVVLRLTAGRCRVRELAAAHTPEFEEEPGAMYEAIAKAVAKSETLGNGE